ncbi:AAA family ATPase AFG2 [Ascoidea rubescens DSM 1968]|uniref:AAA-domain-containing protein n=1 Tax=Ascoidea rubescens DSM 1968 TaxID=1344418 RepID=A0A1D2VH08_9ASCO|nr:AAA-domain-containing protein [Ascoidea rubescens DSM 1968]ODV60915.1 AAA-domain-containing protein [Ascoidea rubescens DSM 1968]
MAKNASLNTPSKSRKSTSKVPDNPPASTAPKIKVPKAFIIRPILSLPHNNLHNDTSLAAANNAVQTPIKSVSKVFINPQVATVLDLSNGALVHLSKENNSNDGLLAIVQSDPEIVEFNVARISQNYLDLTGWLLGDRLVIEKLNYQPDYSLNIFLSVKSFSDNDANITNDNDDNNQNNNKLPTKKINKLLNDLGLIIPGLKFLHESIEYTICDVSNFTDNDGSDILLPQLKNLTINTYSGATKPTQTEITSHNPIYHENLLQNLKRKKLISPVYLYSKSLSQFKISKNPIEDSLLPYKLYNLPKLLTYTSIGGLKNQINKIKSTIELPLFNSNLFYQFNIKPPRGILLYGPPGTGKTMILKAIANSTKLTHILSINGPSIISKYLGGTEEKLTQIFNEARTYQPSIIFVDEIDSLVPSRDSSDSTEIENRTVATLLTLMDGLDNSNNNVIIIASTNRPNSIDSALRRPGRFDQEIEIGIPDIDARFDILKKSIQKMNEKKHNLTQDQIFQIASKTHGYVGADLIALTREAVMKAIERNISLINSKNQNQNNFDNITIQIKDLQNAMIDVRPSVMREIFLEMPKVYWSDIGGQEYLKQKLKEMVQLPLEASDTFRKLGIKPPRGILLYGPPGCSKTLTAKALATESGLNFFAIKGPEIFNKYVGESERTIREIFRKARSASPSILFFDEIDALSADRESGEATTSTANHVLTTLLNEIDGIETLSEVIIVAATNRPDSIDPALLRPGRLDRHIYVAPPDILARLQILKNTTKNFNMDEEMSTNYLEVLASKTDGCSGAEMVLLSQEAGLAAIVENKDCVKVEKRHFEKALTNLPRGITEDLLNYYERFASNSKKFF